MKIRLVPKSSSAPRRKSFAAIPRSFSRAIDKRRFTKEVLGDFFGGGIKGSLNPLKRKDVRSVLEEAGVLGMLDSSARGPRSAHDTKLTEKEAIDILKKTRETVRKNLKEKGWGLSEAGKFRSHDPKMIYRKVVEAGFQEELGQSAAEQQQAAQQERVARARRREMIRQEMGLSSLKKLSEEKTTRREDLERRLEAMRNIQKGPQPKAGPGLGRSSGAASTPGDAQTPAGHGAPAAFSPTVHVPAPGTPPSPDLDEAAPPRSDARPAPASGNDARADAEENPAPDEDNNSGDDRTIDENLPL